MHDSALNAIILTVLAILLGVMIMFYLTQQNTLRAIQPINREISPGSVWYQLIPIYNIYYQFVVVNAISASIDREITSRNDSDSGILPQVVGESGSKNLRTVGLAYCILGLLAWLPVIGTVFSFAAIIFIVVYWVKLAQIKKQIEGAIAI